MNTQVWKFPVEFGDWPVVMMPAGARIIDFRTQGGAPFLWAVVDPEAEPEERRFRLAGTGHELGDVGEFLGTVHLCHGSLVFHLFDTPRVFSQPAAALSGASS